MHALDCEANLITCLSSNNMGVGRDENDCHLYILMCTLFKGGSSDALYTEVINAIFRRW